VEFGLILVLAACNPAGNEGARINTRMDTPSPLRVVSTHLPTNMPMPLFTAEPTIKCMAESTLSSKTTSTPTSTPTNIKLAPKLPTHLIPYDKKHWTRYDNETMGFPGGHLIGDVVVGHDDTIWAGSDDGLTHFDGKTWKTYSKKDGFDDSYLFVDRKGNVWTRNSKGNKSQIARYNGQKWDFFDSPLSASSMAEDKNGVLWFSGQLQDIPGDDITSFDGKTWKSYSLTDQEGDIVHVGGKAFDSKGYLWGGTNDGLYYFDSKNWHFISNQELGVKTSEYSPGLNDFIIAGDDTIWLVINTRFLIKYKDGISTVYQNEYLSQLDPFLGTSLFMDHSGTLWIGGGSMSFSDSRPLLKFNEAGWEVFDQTELGYVSDITQAPDGNIWVSTAGAIYRYQP
jgi:ligand-binding sensor domain-containing protein